MLHIAYRKTCRYYICEMSLRANISDLLNVFNITPIIKEFVENETRAFIRQGLTSRYIELTCLSMFVMYV